QVVRSLLFDGEFGPARQGRRAIPQEYDATCLGEGQVGGQRAVVDRELLQNLPVVGVGGVEPGALRKQSAAPTHGDQAGTVLARFGEFLFQLVETAVEQT